jgi:hypothetical protein
LARKKKCYTAVKGVFDHRACLGLPNTSQKFEWGVSCTVIDGGSLKITALLGELFEIVRINLFGEILIFGPPAIVTLIKHNFIRKLPCFSRAIPI